MSDDALPWLPYGRPTVDEADIETVVQVLRTPWLTTGPMIEAFEQAFARAARAEHAIAVSSGTAALHAALHVLDLQPGDEVILPTLTFAATANAVCYVGATPVFADVEPGTLLLGPEQVAARITPRTKAVIAVDYAGQPCDYAALRELCERHQLHLLSDACHSLGGSYRGQSVGTLADLNLFSLHPVKAITSGEGGVITTERADLAQRLRQFRNHGISTDVRQREAQGTWYYEQVELGYNYRLSDIHAALGLSQLQKLSAWVKKRCELAALYDSHLRELAESHGVEPLAVRDDVGHAWHLYVVRLNAERSGLDRRQWFDTFRQARIGVQVHYLPVHWHPYYRQHFGTLHGQCPIAEAAYEQILSLPLFPAMTAADVERVVEVFTKQLRR